jgi:uncharacterized membrane protein
MIVANRAEIRYIHGIGPLLDLLSAEYNEILENALNSLIRCAEDRKRTWRGFRRVKLTFFQMEIALKFENKVVLKSSWIFSLKRS